MARVLGDHGVHHAAQKAPAGDVGQIVPDEGYGRVPACAGIVVATRAGHVGYERDDISSAGDEIFEAVFRLREPPRS